MTTTNAYTYADVAEQGYRLLGLSERVFPQSTDQEEEPQALIISGPVVLERRSANSRAHVWSNGEGQGVVLLDFEPGQVRADTFLGERIESEMADMFELHSGILLYLPYEDDDYGKRRLYCPSDQFDRDWPDLKTYPEVKLIGHEMVEHAVGIPHERPMSFHVQDLSIEPGFKALTLLLPPKWA